MKIIEVKNLSKIYYSSPKGRPRRAPAGGVEPYKNDGAETHALRNISFDIEKGEYVAIMGPSGSGKSTLLHMLGFLDTATSGTYLFNGKSIDEYTSDEAAKIRNKEMGFIFQMFNLLPRTSVLDNVKLPLFYSDIDASKWDEMANDAIESVGMTYRINHEPSQLSGGEQQRAAISRALVLNPGVIFADEPTGNLDSKSGKMIMETLQHLHEDHGNTIILITHETYTASHATRVIRLLDGEIESDKKVEHRLRAEKFKK
ncbi:ABC transporter ATP-binding protein [Candidatus Peregrinibacteria bacterium]|nr:ABC transporter ATP-binding protein [Candidatus Peregrinibacteria bacterium]